jgi:hypothetical protein
MCYTGHIILLGQSNVKGCGAWAFYCKRNTYRFFMYLQRIGRPLRTAGKLGRWYKGNIVMGVTEEAVRT